jgi:steroid 5-alpha reductase family enzyme
VNKTLRSFVVIGIAISIAVGLSVALAEGSISLFGLPAVVVCAIVSFAIQWLMFLPSFYFQTEHYFDLTGSLTYIGLIALLMFAGTEHDARSVLVSLLVIIWAGRLGNFLFLRVKKAGKDGRFDVIKQSWPRFLVTWTLQGLWVFVTLLAALVVITNRNSVPLGGFAYVGLFLWALGFGIEVVADSQKTVFNRDVANAGHFVNVGLWSWSRHPNYFGEIVLWTGIAVIAVPLLQGWQWLALVSPIFVTLLLTKISGIPLLEKRADEKWGEAPEYQAYKASTSVLLPMPPRGSNV